MDFILFIIIVFQMAAADLKYRPALHSVLGMNFALGRVTACRETLISLVWLMSGEA